MTIRKVGYESGLDMVWHTTELLRGCCEEGLNGILRNSLFYDYPQGCSMDPRTVNSRSSGMLLACR